MSAEDHIRQLVLTFMSQGSFWFVLIIGLILWSGRRHERPRAGVLMLSGMGLLAASHLITPFLWQVISKTVMDNANDPRVMFAIASFVSMIPHSAGLFLLILAALDTTPSPQQSSHWNDDLS
ncbi:MAG: hypothetical protein KDA58_03460 [Planctomycetaceae bacterium]|nr:hypothetical protein [Planctomycetaceae bacterium]